MLSTIRLFIITMSSLYLSSCMIDSPDPYSSSSSYPTTTEEGLYPDGYEMPTMNQIPNTPTYIELPAENNANKLVIPDNISHVSAKNMDQQWVSKQNPDAYTIELAQSPQASIVASTLSKAPKNARTAEIKSNNGNYLGVYGSYQSYESAVEKFNSLPADLKTSSKIIAWKDISGYSAR